MPGGRGNTQMSVMDYTNQINSRLTDQVNAIHTLQKDIFAKVSTMFLSYVSRANAAGITGFIPQLSSDREISPTVVSISRNGVLSANGSQIDMSTLGTIRINSPNVLINGSPQSNAPNTSALTASVTTLSTTVSGLNSSTANLSTTVSGLNSSVTNLGTSVSGLNSSMTNLNTRVSGLSLSVSSMTTLTTSVSGLNSSMTTLSTSVSGLNTSVANLGTTVSGLNTSVANLGTTVSGLNSSVTNLNTSIAGLATSSSGFGSSIAALNSSIAGILNDYLPKAGGILSGPLMLSQLVPVNPLSGISVAGKLFINGGRPVCSGGFSMTVNPSPLINSVIETSMIGTGIGSLMSPVGSIMVGGCSRSFMSGFIDTAGSATITFRVYSGPGSSVLLSTFAINLGSISRVPWRLETMMTCRAVGAGIIGKMQVNSIFMIHNTSNGSSVYMNNPLVNIDTTQANTFNVTAQWGSAAGNVLSVDTFNTMNTFFT